MSILIFKWADAIWYSFILYLCNKTRLIKKIFCAASRCDKFLWRPLKMLICRVCCINSFIIKRFAYNYMTALSVFFIRFFYLTQVNFSCAATLSRQVIKIILVRIDDTFFFKNVELITISVWLFVFVKQPKKLSQTTFRNWRLWSKP